MKINKNICIVFIYILLYISALSYLRYTATNSPIMSVVRVSCMYGILVLGILYLLLKKKYHRSWLYPLVGGMVLFELASSAFNSLFIFPIILVDVVVWPLLFIVFYTYSRDTNFSKSFKIITLIGIIAIIIIAIPNTRMGYSIENGSALFITYFCITFLPLSYIFLSDKLSLILSILVNILMLMTLKRAALIAVVAGIFFFYIIKSHNKGDSITIKRLLKFMIAILLIIISSKWVIDKFDLNILERMSNIFEDGGSGRTRIWEVVLYQFNSSTSLKKWFGHGFHAVYYQIRPLGISRFAHNSFLEMLYDYGYIGVSFLMIFVINVILKTKKLIKDKHYLAPVMGYTLAPMMVFGVASYFFEQGVIILPFCVVWGICLGTYEKEKSIKKYKL